MSDFRTYRERQRGEVLAMMASIRRDVTEVMGQQLARPTEEGMKYLASLLLEKQQIPAPAPEGLTTLVLGYIIGAADVRFPKPEPVTPPELAFPTSSQFEVNNMPDGGVE